MRHYLNFGGGLLLVCLLLFVGGCAAPESAVTKRYDIDMQTDDGHNVLVLVLDADVDSNTAVRQDAKTDARTKLDAALAQNGSTQQNARDSAGAAMDGIKSILDATNDSRQTESNNDNSRPAAAIPVVAPTQSALEKAEVQSGEFNTTETHSLEALKGNNKKFTWLPETGSYYGGEIKFSFPGCADLLVPDATTTIGADGSKGTNQAYCFCGTDFPVGSHENLNYRASVFAPPGCAADTVIMAYNKE